MSGSSSSHRPPPPPPPPQRSSETNDVTWLDFLRTAGGTVPAENYASSGDRKRRHAGSSPERRGYPYAAYAANNSMTGRRPSGMSIAGAPGSSSDNVIDLTTPPRSHHQQQRAQIPQASNQTFEGMVATRPASRYSASGSSTRGSLTGRRRESDIMLPLWQPDSEVSKCPVCQKDFTIIHRKHHCRKCGRVVCATCSPHRITIPKQYIVRPPNSADGDQSLPSQVSGGSYDQNLGGGDVVRVCNPCVPDPWTPESAPSQQTRPRPAPSRPNIDLNEFAERFRQPNNQQAISGGRQAFAQTRMREPQDANALHELMWRVDQRLLEGNQASPRAVDDRAAASRARAQSLQQYQSGRRIPYATPPSAFRDGSLPQPSELLRSSTQHVRNGSNAAFPAMPPGQMPRPVPPPRAGHARPRREVQEEDECPVCGIELPQGEDLREAHITDCIKVRFASTPTYSSVPAQPAPAPPPRTTSVPGRSNLNSLHNPNFWAEVARTESSTPTGSRPRATSYRPRGMAVYKATEKDCTNEEGEAQECVICFEEFQPGDEMGRMECLCKFHRVCIRRWWDTKGTGSCPTHQLHD